MYTGRFAILAVACILMSCRAIAETPAGHPELEENPGKIRAMSCDDLDGAMSLNFGVTFIAQTSGNIFDDAIAKGCVRRFKLEQKEYKSRCKGEPAQLKAARKTHSRSKYLPE